LNPRWLRSQIATVSQEPILLPLTIRENITFGCPREPTLDEIYDACKVANIYDSLMDKDKFPSGLRTELSAVQNISGGEKQRIAIARAVLADPPILLLDEATSALDEENQSKVQDALNKLMKGRTTLVIAHRLSTIKDSDKIVSFSKGTVVECGSHDELVNKEGYIYGGLWKKQCSSPSGDDCNDYPDLEAEDDKNEEEEEIEKLDLKQRRQRAQSMLIAGGNNPPPSMASRLDALEQRLTSYAQISNGTALGPSFMKELRSIVEELKLDAALAKDAKEDLLKLHPSRALGLTATSVNRWKAQVGKGKGESKFKSAANKVVFKNLHTKISKQLSSAEEEQ